MNDVVNNRGSEGTVTSPTLAGESRASVPALHDEGIALLLSRIDELDRRLGNTAAPADPAPDTEPDDPTQRLLKKLAKLQIERDSATASVARRFDEIVALTQLLETSRKHGDTASVQLQKLKRQLAESTTKSERLRVAHAKLTKTVRALEESHERKNQQQFALVAALQRVHATRMRDRLRAYFRDLVIQIDTAALRRRQERSGGRSFPGGQKELERASALLRKSVFFDRRWYLTRYPDVAESKLLPDLHYLKYGAAEGRDPGPLFSTSRYLELYPDVVRSQINPLVHYITHGIREGRVIEPAAGK